MNAPNRIRDLLSFDPTGWTMALSVNTPTSKRPLIVGAKHEGDERKHLPLFQTPKLAAEFFYADGHDKPPVLPFAGLVTVKDGATLKALLLALPGSPTMVLNPTVVVGADGTRTVEWAEVVQ